MTVAVQPSLEGPGSGRLALVAVVLVLLLSLPVGAASAVESRDANVTVYRSPDASFESARAVEAAVANGSLEPAEELVVGDTLVVAIDSRRLAETMAAGNGSTTDRFLDALDGDAEFRIVQTNPTPMKNRKVASLGRQNLTVLRDGTTSYVLVETGNLTFRYRGANRSAEIFGRERFAVRFGYDLPDLSRGGDDPASPMIGFHPLRAEFVTNGNWYEPLPPEWVRLPVNVETAPDDSLVARVRLEGDRTIAARVEPHDVPSRDGVWLDLRDVEPGIGYTLELVHDGEVVDRHDGIVREPEATLANATLVRVGNGTAVEVSVSASHGGQVRVLDGSCEALGTKWVDPGGERRTTIELWDDSGHRIQGHPGVLVRVAHPAGASDALYRGSTADVTVGLEGDTCPVEARPSTPTPSPTGRPTTPIPGESTATGTPFPTTVPARGTVPPGGTGPTTGGGRTSGDGGSGFTALASLLALAGLARFRARGR